MQELAATNVRPEAWLRMRCRYRASALFSDLRRNCTRQKQGQYSVVIRMPRDFEQHVLPGLELSDFAAVVSQTIDRHVVHLDDHVAAREFNILTETGRLHLRDHHAGEFAHAKLPRDVRSELFDMQAELARLFTLIGLFFGVHGCLREYLRAIGHDHGNVLGHFVADGADLYGMANCGLRDRVHEIGACVNRRSVDIRDYVSRFQAGFVGGASRLNRFDYNSIWGAELSQ